MPAVLDRRLFCLFVSIAWSLCRNLLLAPNLTQLMRLFNKIGLVIQNYRINSNHFFKHTLHSLNPFLSYVQAECGIKMGGEPLLMVLLTSKRNKYDSYSLAHDGGYNLTRTLW